MYIGDFSLKADIRPRAVFLISRDFHQCALVVLANRSLYIKNILRMREIVKRMYSNTSNQFIISFKSKNTNSFREVNSLKVFVWIL